MGAAEATRPLAEIALAADAGTPFLIGFLGPSGSGASFALRCWVDNVEALAEAAARTAGSPFLSKIVVASIDAAGVSGDPAWAIASATFAALERDRDGVNYAALADEAAHAGADPLRAAAAAADRHDELARRLESERAARDDIETKRARLTDALLYETPGSRVDAFIRAQARRDRSRGCAGSISPTATPTATSATCCATSTAPDRWRAPASRCARSGAIAASSAG